jgi:hypothetical protein
MEKSEREKNNHPELKSYRWFFLIIGALGAFWVFLTRYLHYKALKRKALQRKLAQPAHEGIQGLTENEADVLRKEGLDNTVNFEPPRTFKDMLKDYTLTVFNISLIGVAIVQIMLGLYSDGFFTLIVALLCIGISLGQELFVRKKLQNAVQATRPMATVIRDGQAWSRDPSEIVQGDALVVGPGDEFVADGVMLSKEPIMVDESMLIGEGSAITKHYGDYVFAGSFCVSGRGAYQAQIVGEERMIAKLVSTAPKPRKVLTPLEKMVERVLTVMLVIVAIMISVLFMRYSKLDTTIGVDTDAFISATIVIFNLAPAGLYFMVFLNYMTGTLQLAKRGALAHRARSVETLAYTSDICLTQASTRASSLIRMETYKSEETEKTEELDEMDDVQKKLSDSRIRQILGDFSQSVVKDNLIVNALTLTFPGQSRTLQSEMHFLSAYGWIAAVFDDDDLRGVCVFGEPRVLNPYIVKTALENKKEGGDKEGEKRNVAKTLKSGISTIGSLFRRGKQSTQHESDEESRDEKNPVEAISAEKSPETQPENNIQEIKSKRKPVRSFFKRITSSLKADKKDSKEPEDNLKEDELENQFPRELEYIFAYSPETSALYNERGEPQIPHSLLPLCHLFYSNEIQPETVNNAQKLIEGGVKLKVFSPGAPDRLMDALGKVRIGIERDTTNQLIPASELTSMDRDTYNCAVTEKSFFSYINTEQSRQIVETLQDNGKVVTVIAGGPSDLPIMQQADISITSVEGSQAAMSVADIILLKDSPNVLLRVLRMGQIIVTGVMDVLKLYITQLVYLVLLILLLVGVGYGFPYTSKQGSFVAIVTLALPSLVYSLWPIYYPPPKVDQFGSILTKFVAPAAVGISLVGTALFIYFAETTGDIAYAQLVLTYMLTFSGLALVITIRPPTGRILVEEPQEAGIDAKDAYKRDLNPTIFVVVISVLTVLWAPKDWMYKFFEMEPLRQSTDYLTAVIAVIVWLVVVNIIWLILRPKKQPKAKG